MVIQSDWWWLQHDSLYFSIECWYSDAINHPPFITMFMGGVPTIKNGWFIGAIPTSYWECHPLNWRTHIFQKGMSTSNQKLSGLWVKCHGRLLKGLNNLFSGDDIHDLIESLYNSDEWISLGALGALQCLVLSDMVCSQTWYLNIFLLVFSPGNHPKYGGFPFR